MRVLSLYLVQILGFACLWRLHRVFEHIHLRRRIRNLYSQSKTDEPLNLYAEGSA